VNRRLVIVSIAAIAAATATAALAGGSPAPASCPRSALPLGTNAIGPAVLAALRGDRVANRPTVVAAAIAAADTAGRGAQVSAECGKAVANRTVVVSITDRALLPSASLSQRVVFVSRFPSGYRVWQRAH
jgi:hypothetical protein